MTAGFTVVGGPGRTDYNLDLSKQRAADLAALWTSRADDGATYRAVRKTTI